MWGNAKQLSHTLEGHRISSQLQLPERFFDTNEK